ncbi:MAG: hypothetical protein KF809_18445 [Chloroflexi bacterium]|nr:hypothetical protein [Chloroflexota bacterium]
MARSAPTPIGRLAIVLLALVTLTGCALLPDRGAAIRTDVLPALEAVASAGPWASSGPAPGPTLDAPPVPSVVPGPMASPDLARDLRPRPREGRFRMDLYTANDHVAQFDPSWCVGASMQMMINLMEDGRPDRSRATQRELYQLAREISPWVETRPGASTYGWAGGLTQLGYGPYAELSAGSRGAALRLAARQMRFTGKPVGLLVWRGRHAWVMSGFQATADPAYTDDFRVTAVWIEDPWSGRVSSIWGPGLEPHTRVPTDELQGFTRWASRHRPEYGPRGEFVIIAPLLEETADGLAPIAREERAPAA